MTASRWTVRREVVNSGERRWVIRKPGGASVAHFMLRVPALTVAHYLASLSANEGRPST